MKRFVLLLTLFLLFGIVTQAQDLTETYAPPSGSIFTFDYPAGWMLDDSTANIELTSPDGLIIGVLNVDVTSRVGADLTPAETLDLLMNFTQFPADEVTTVMVGSREVARGGFSQNNGREAVAAAVRFSGSDTGVVVGIAPVGRLDEVEPIVMAVAASLRLADTPAEATAAAETTPEAETTEAVAEPLPEGVLFQDDFESGLNADWVASQGTPTIVQDGDNHVLRVDSDQAYSLTSGADWTDYAADLRVKVNQQADIDGLVGVRFNPQNVTTYGAFFSTQSDRVGLAYFFGDNQFNILSTSRVNLSAGQWYNLTLTVKGDLVELYFGSHRTNWINSTQFDRGSLALYASPNAQLYVDDVVIRDLRD